MSGRYPDYSAAFATTRVMVIVVVSLLVIAFAANLALITWLSDGAWP
jgi:hypothetical protein